MAQKSTSKEPTSRKEAILSRRQIEHMIAEGHAIFILDSCVIKADAWLKFHPGGDKAIMHMIGRDATDEVQAYEVHYRMPTQKLILPCLVSTLLMPVDS